MHIVLNNSMLKTGRLMFGSFKPEKTFLGNGRPESLYFQIYQSTPLFIFQDVCKMLRLHPQQTRPRYRPHAYSQFAKQWPDLYLCL